MCNGLENGQEKPTNCGTKAADALAKFLAGKRNANPLNTYFGAFATTMTSQRLSFQSLAPSATGWPSFEGGVVLRIPNLGMRRRVVGSWVAPIESPPTTSQYLSIQSCALSATVWSEFFQCQIIGTSPNLTPIWEVRVDVAGPKWLQSKCWSHIPIQLL